MGTALALLLTADPMLIESVAALAGAAGLALEVRSDCEAQSWSSADSVLIGADVLNEVSALRPARRPGVIVVADGADDHCWRPALEVGAEHVAFLPVAQEWLTDRLSDVAEGPGKGGAVIGILAGSGGAGASTLAAGLAQAGAQSGLAPLLIDLDPLGAGLDLLFGAEREPGRRWPELRSVRGRLAAGVLAESLPVAHGVRILAWGPGMPEPLAPGAVQSVLAAASRGHDLVVVDLPRRFDAAALAVTAGLDRALVVATDDLRSAVATSRVAGSLGRTPVGLLVRRRSGAMTDVDVADVCGLGLLGQYRSDPDLAAAAERGDPPLVRRGNFRDTCLRLINEVAGDRAA